MIWTDEQITTLKDLYAQGLPHSQIGAALGISRNASIGKLLRLGLDPRGPERPTPKRRPTQISGQTVRRINKRIWTARGQILVEEKLKPLPGLKSMKDHAPESRCKTLMELTSRDCRFPFGDVGDPDFHFCGAMAVPTYSYCIHHCRIAYAGIPVRHDRVRVR